MICLLLSVFYPLSEDEKLAKEGLVAGVERRDITEADMFAAREIIACGTTIHVVSVTSYEGKPVADGKPGPVSAALQRMLEEEMGLNP